MVFFCQSPDQRLDSQQGKSSNSCSEFDWTIQFECATVDDSLFSSSIRGGVHGHEHHDSGPGSTGRTFIRIRAADNRRSEEQEAHAILGDAVIEPDVPEESCRVYARVFR